MGVLSHCGVKGTLRVLQLVNRSLTVFCVKTSTPPGMGQVSEQNLLCIWACVDQGGTCQACGFDSSCIAQAWFV